MKTFRRIAAMIGVIVLVGLYVITLVLALIGSPASRNMLMAAIVCTVVIPVLLYAMMLVARILGDRGGSGRPDDTKKKK